MLISCSSKKNEIGTQCYKVIIENKKPRLRKLELTSLFEYDERGNLLKEIYKNDETTYEYNSRLSSTKRLKMASLTASGRSGAAPFSLSSQ